MPIQNEARERAWTLEPEWEAPGPRPVRECPGRRFGELVEREDEHLGRMQPATQLGIAERGLRNHAIKVDSGGGPTALAVNVNEWLLQDGLRGLPRRVPFS